MAGFGGAVKLTGESEYRQAITQITQDLQKMSGALKSQTADFSANDKSISNTASKQAELNEAIKAQQAELAKAKNAYAQYSVEVQAQTTRHNALSKEYKNAVLELDRIKSASGTASEEYKKQSAVVDTLGQELADSTAKLNESKSAMNSLKSEINNSSRVMTNASKEVDNLGNETKETGDQAKEAGQGFTVLKGILANLGTQAINSVINGMKQLGGAFVNVGKEAVGSFAQFEQLEGGVKKLFGDDVAQSVIDNAKNAFATAGMSANEYMETVTNFSASLISGLGGDTAEASKIADLALRDMSDNANTFGTDMASIQHAYQGFAKGNFTMLDNLKLGYGGTQSEMARLINESGVLGDSMEVTAETVKNVPFDKMILAINKVQKDMGITGTTAKEAMSTIEGSTNSAKKAWQNMLIGMADENTNFEQLATDFVGTLISPDGQGGVFGTLIPRITQVITGMSNVIQTLLPQLVQQVVLLIQQNLPIIMTAVQNALQTILAVLPEVLPIIAQLIPQIVSTLVSLLPQIVDAGIQILLSLIDGISETIPQLVQMLPDIIKNIVDVLIKNLPQIIETGVELLVGLIEGLTEAIPQLIDYVPEIVSTITEVLIQNLPMIVDSAVKIMVALVNGLIQSLPKLIAMTPRIITTIVSTLIKNLPQIIQGGVQILASLVSGLMQNIGNLALKAKEIGQTVLDKVLEFPSKMLEAGKDLVRGIWEGITGSLSWIKEKIKGWVGNVTGFIKKLFGINSPSKLFRDEIGENLALGIGEGFSDEMKNVASDMSDSIPTSFDVDSSINGVSGSRSASWSYDNMVDAFKTALSEMKIELDDEVAGQFVDKTVTRLIYN